MSAATYPTTAGADGATKPIELAVPLPNAPASSVCINLHLTMNSHSIVLFMTTSATDTPPSSCPMGSFVYAMPNLRSPSSPPLTTALFPQTDTIDLATRMASVLAKKTGKPTYVGNSMSLTSAGRGGDADEEIAAFRRVVDVVMAEVERTAEGKMVNGT